MSKYKARFVARGFTQRHGDDYTDTFSPTTKLSTIRILLSIAANRNMRLKQLDIKSAYLNAPIEEEVYLVQPQGFEVKSGDGETLYCRLNKSLYGLKQSGRNWYMELKGHLESLGFKESQNDQCLFLRTAGAALDCVCVWVDDIIYASTREQFYEIFERDITSRYQVSDMSDLKWFLGMKIDVEKEIIKISQAKYIENLLAKFGMRDCKAVTTPIAEGTKLSKADCPEEGSEEQSEMSGRDYRGLVGSINYLSVSSRPDIANAAHLLSAFVQNPGICHWIAAKHVLRYLKGTMYHSLTYTKNGTDMAVEAFSDADWAGNIDNRRSTSGYCIRLFSDSGCVTWRSKTQSTVATSTAESELNAAVIAIQELKYVNGILSDFGYEVQMPMVLNVDNQALIAMSKNPVQSNKSKHFALKLCYLREQVNEGFLKLSYTSTNEMPADILTKPIGKLKTRRFSAFLFGISE